MLASSTIKQLEQIKAALTVYVEAAFSAYEQESGPFEISKNRSTYVVTFLDLYGSIVDRVITQKPLTILPLTFKITATLITLSFNLELFLRLLVSINEVVKASYIREGPRNVTIEQSLDSYIDLILQSQQGLQYYLDGLGSDQLIQLIKEYHPSTTIIRDVLVDQKVKNRVLYPLFGEDLYWEIQRDNYLEKDISEYPTKKLAIYKDELYILNQNISRPNTDEFSSAEWGTFTSKFLLKTKTFNNKLKTNIELYVNNALENSNDINGVISDSSIKEIPSFKSYSEKDLSLSFAGKGKEIFNNLVTLNETIKFFGNSESSPIGNIDYIASFCEYLYASTYSRITNSGFTQIEGLNGFGSFNFIFSYDPSVNKIAGLKFLENFKSLSSFKQGISIPDDITISKDGKTNSIEYNPIYAKFSSGLKDRFRNDPKNVYVESPVIPEQSDNYVIDVLLFGIEQINNLANTLGDTLGAVGSSLDDNGKLAGYEGLGSISAQISELQKIFIDSNTIETNYANQKVSPGFNGLTRYLLESYKRLTDVVPNIPFTGSSLAYISEWARSVQKILESIIDDIESIGYLPGSFIPNISFKFSATDEEKLIDQLRSLNFQESEIIQFLSLSSFEELIEKFAPITDSSDQISFFKGYELSRLIYEFGGESAVDSYISYLYSADENNLINLLKLSLKDKSEAVTFNESRYGKLIGLLINLPFALTPDQLELFRQVLSGNSLTLFESISFLLINKERNILKTKEEISLLAPITKSLIYGKSIFDTSSYNIDYEVANREAPVALQQLTALIDKNVGNSSTVLLQNLFDKSVGLTTKELVSIINPVSETTELGQILSSESGGKLTKLINYAYVSGLVHKLSYYSNSYQVPNFYISGQSLVRLEALVGLMRALSFSLDLTLTNFINSLEYVLSQDTLGLYSFSNIYNLSNKNIDQVSKVVQDLTPLNNDVTNFGSPSIPEEASILSAPGIGNSPVPESIPKENSITHEQANVLSPTVKQNFSFIANRINKNISEGEITEKFISFIEQNKVLSGSPKINNVVQAQSNLNKDITDQASNEVIKDTDRNVPLLILDRDKNNDYGNIVKNEVLDSLLSQGLLDNFDNVESCKKFGGTKCENRYPNKVNECGLPTNKSTYSQRDDSPNSTAASGSIPIDRPYGEGLNGMNSFEFYPVSDNNKPIYFNVFNPEKVSITRGGVPLLSEISDIPIVFTKDGSESPATIAFNKDVDIGEQYFSSYYNSEFGLIESIKARFEKDDAFNCSLLEDPYAYNACMNLLKCKRFERKGGASSLRFCPRTLAGGLFK